MCGIVGVFDLNEKRPVDKELLGRMNDSQQHRGPDDFGIFSDAGIGLGHRRLSIIDLSNGHQPMTTRDNSCVLVYNGEIYNFQEIKLELEKAGHIFNTHCDTEVILYAYKEWGEACVEKFRGMFAFALWDKTKESLFLVRDRIGIKPLYYTVLESRWLVFSSELKAIKCHPDFKPELNIQAVEDYFSYCYIPDPKTIFNNVFKLPPGHLMTVKIGDKNLKPRQYWDLKFEDNYPEDEDALAKELTERLREAVDIRLLAEVPLGAFLSGGVDSSTVVAMMSELMNDPVKTCSISFDVPSYDESSFAEEVADRYKTSHEVKQVEVDDFALINQLDEIYDEPFADDSAIPTYRVCELAREKVTVALSGDGGDENFAGYHRHRWHHYEEIVRGILPDPVRIPIFKTLGKIYPRIEWAPKIFRAKPTLQGIGRSSVDGYFHNVNIIDTDIRKNMFSSRLKSDLGGYSSLQVLQDCFDNCQSDDDIQKIIYADFKTYLPGDILVKVDRASMANSLEVRVPFLDHKFVEWSTGIPSNLKLKNREGKMILKKAMEPYLSDNILYRDKKGFAVPIGHWFRGPLKETIREKILGQPLADSGLFDMDFLKTMLDRHQSGFSEYTEALWALLVFSMFYQNNFG